MRITSVLCFRSLFLTVPFHYFLRGFVCHEKESGQLEHTFFIVANLFEVFTFNLQNLSNPSSLLTKTSFERSSTDDIPNASLKNT